MALCAGSCVAPAPLDQAADLVKYVGSFTAGRVGLVRAGPTPDNPRVVFRASAGSPDDTDVAAWITDSETSRAFIVHRLWPHIMATGAAHYHLHDDGTLECVNIALPHEDLSDSESGESTPSE